MLPHQTGSSLTLWILLCALVGSLIRNTRGQSPSCSYKVGSFKLSKMCWFAKSKCFFNWNQRAKLNSWKTQPTAINLLPPNFDTMCSDKDHSPSKVQIQTCPRMFFLIKAPDALHSTWWCEVWMQIVVENQLPLHLLNHFVFHDRPCFCWVVLFPVASTRSRLWNIHYWGNFGSALIGQVAP